MSAGRPRGRRRPWRLGHAWRTRGSSDERRDPPVRPPRRARPPHQHHRFCCLQGGAYCRNARPVGAGGYARTLQGSRAGLDAPICPKVAAEQRNERGAPQVPPTSTHAIAQDTASSAVGNGTSVVLVIGALDGDVQTCSPRVARAAHSSHLITCSTVNARDSRRCYSDESFDTWSNDADIGHVVRGRNGSALHCRPWR
jgi:hypothetical protein